MGPQLGTAQTNKTSLSYIRSTAGKKEMMPTLGHDSDIGSIDLHILYYTTFCVVSLSLLFAHPLDLFIFLIFHSLSSCCHYCYPPTLSVPFSSKHTDADSYRQQSGIAEHPYRHMRLLTIETPRWH